MKKLLALMALLLLAPPSFAEYKQGKQYEATPAPQPTSSGDKIEVIELFWYGCPHCYHLEPDLKAWLADKPDDVVFVRMPAASIPQWELLARAYYTADLLDALDKIHQPLFERIHKDRKMIRNEAELKAFFVEQGISAEDFDNTFKSFAVVTKTNRAKQVRDLYGVTGVPMLVVNGKYRTSASMAGGNANMFKVVDFLVSKERGASVSQAETAAQ
jgi:thiol:disulfide interchange protein DsbA